ncbi:MAG: poly-gamma-glutamate system protein [Candidatus Methanomethyliaceae archaeon]
MPSSKSAVQQRKKDIKFLTLTALISVAAFLIATRGQIIADPELRTKMRSAANLMDVAIKTVRQYRSVIGIPVSPDDINFTGLIGLRYSPITTTIGDLGAKRTSTNPNFAALVVYLLTQAGAQQGDAIAIGASGSFPALIIATLSAAKAMGLYPVLICSLGASQWGANDPEFTWVDIENCLIEAGVFPTEFRAVALSIGGDKDIGLEMPPEGRQVLIQKINEHPGTFIYSDDLQENKQIRIRLYQRHAKNRKVPVFVSIGGNWVDLGEDPAVLKLTSGLNVIEKIPESESRGLLFEMAAQGMVVIHLLNIRDLALRFGLPWDPSPLPEPGTGYIFTHLTMRPIVSLPVLSAVYFGSIVCLFVFWRYISTN